MIIRLDKEYSLKVAESDYDLLFEYEGTDKDGNKKVRTKTVCHPSNVEHAIRRTIAHKAHRSQETVELKEYLKMITDWRDELIRRVGDV